MKRTLWLALVFGAALSAPPAFAQDKAGEPETQAPVPATGQDDEIGQEPGTDQDSDAAPEQAVGQQSETDQDVPGKTKPQQATPKKRLEQVVGVITKIELKAGTIRVSPPPSTGQTQQQAAPPKQKPEELVFRLDKTSKVELGGGKGSPVPAKPKPRKTKPQPGQQPTQNEEPDQSAEKPRPDAEQDTDQTPEKPKTKPPVVDVDQDPGQETGQAPIQTQVAPKVKPGQAQGQTQGKPKPKVRPGQTSPGQDSDAAPVAGTISQLRVGQLVQVFYDEVPGQNLPRAARIRVLQSGEPADKAEEPK